MSIDTAGIEITRDGLAIRLNISGPGVTVTLTPMQARAFARDLLDHVVTASADGRTSVSISLGARGEAVLSIRTAIRFAEQLTAIATEE